MRVGVVGVGADFEAGGGEDGGGGGGDCGFEGFGVWEAVLVGEGDFVGKGCLVERVCLLGSLVLWRHLCRTSRGPQSSWAPKEG